MSRSHFFARHARHARPMLLVIALGGLAANARASAVELRAEPMSHGATITLGDLFIGAPAASVGLVLGEAAPAGGEAVLEAGRIQAAARRVGLDWNNSSGQRRIIVASSADPRPAPLAYGDLKRESVLTYARALAAGEIVRASDVVWSREAVAPSDAPHDAEEVIGKAARRPLRPGSAVGAHDLTRPQVVRRDDVVEVAFEDGGVTLRLEAKALSDAAVGDTLEVINTQSKKVLEVVAAGPGRTLVGPAAEALKTAADPLRIAAR